MVSVESKPPLGTLETGLKSLRSSQLMGVPEFHHMYDAIKTHHKAEKLSNLTRKPKDLIKQGQKDTKFFLILSKMLCEVAGHSGVSQETNLNMVYNWYKINRSQLKSAPKFGKSAKNKLNADLRLDGTGKAISPRMSAKHHQRDKRQKSAHLSYAHAPSLSDMISHDSMDDNISAGWTMSRSPSPSTDMRTYTAVSDDEEIYEVDHNIVDHYGSSSATRISSWGEDTERKPAPERISSARQRIQKSKNRPTSSALSHHKKQPIISLVNPHGVNRGNDCEEINRHVKFHHSRLNGQSPSQIDAWKEFQHNLINSQDVLGKLSFVGRSGTPYDVRYVAHDDGEMPELYTDHVISSIKKSAQKKKSPPKDRNYLLSQSLGEFCEMTDGYYSPQLQQYKNKPKSASGRSPFSGQAGQSQAKIQPLGHLLQDSQQQQQHSFKSNLKSHSEPDMNPHVKVTTLMNVIDTVTANMNYFKEKIAPIPKPGFRHPASATTHLLPTRPVSVPAANINKHRLSPVNRPVSAYTRLVTDTSSESIASPILDSNLPRHSPETPKRSRSPAEVMSAGQITINYPELSTHVDKLDQAVDWRGKVSPEVISQKWKKTGLGNHTYVQSLKKKKRTLSASRRPKTAPVGVHLTDDLRRNWNSHCNFQPSRSCGPSQFNRPLSQMSCLSSRPSTGYTCNNLPDSRSYPIDQDDVDEMLLVKYLGGTSEEYEHSTWYDTHYDGALLARLSETQLDDRVRDYEKPPPNLEFLTLVTPKRALVGEKNVKSTSESRQLDVGSNPGSETFCDSDVNSLRSDLEENSHYDQGESELDLDLDLLRNGEKEIQKSSEGDNDLDNVNEQVASGCKFNLQRHTCGSGTETVIDPGADLSKQEAITGHPDNNEEHTKTNSTDPEAVHSEATNVKSVAVRSQATTVESLACNVNPLSLNLEQIANDDNNEWNQENSEIPDTPRGRHLHSQVFSDPWIYSEDVDSPKLEHDGLPKRPITGRAPLSARKESKTDTEPLVDKMFRDDKNQHTAGRSVLNRSQSAGVQVCRLLRKPGDLAPPPRTAPSIPSGFHKSGRPRTPRHGQTFMSELDQHARRIQTSRQYVEKVNCLRSVNDSFPSAWSDSSDDLASGILTVCRLPRPNKKRPRNLSSAGSALSDEERRLNPSPVSTLNPTRSMVGSSGMGHEQGQVDSVPSKEKINPVSVGRPIPSCLELQDPVELAFQVERQKQAKAVVDIQRIFRGYVARNYYIKLQKEERERREDEQKAAVAIQRTFKQHLSKMKSIYNRPKLDPELQTWAKEYGTMKKISEVERQIKRDEDVREMTEHQLESSAKLSVIGPHVEIYQIYHQKTTGPTMTFLHQAALVIQRYIRGYLVRKKLTSLRRKALYQGSNWTRCVEEYKHMLWKVQERHGVIRPKMPFTFTQINEFMDTRRRYESIFEKKAFGGELDVTDLPQFFKECDLCPSHTEMDDALDVVVRGALEPSRGLYKSEAMEILFHIYPPPAAGLLNHRTSTWMNPIIDGEEANKLIGSEFVEDAPLSVCLQLVVDSKRERREREKQKRDEEKNRQDQEKHSQA